MRYTTAHYALFARGAARAGETVFIHGASGSVGTSAVQLAKRTGLKVIGSGGTAKGLELILAEGADLAVDHTKDGYLNEVTKFKDGGGPELILEMLANINLAADMDIAAKFGRIIVIGNRGETTPRRHDEGARHSGNRALERDPGTGGTNDGRHPRGRSGRRASAHNRQRNAVSGSGSSTCGGLGAGSFRKDRSYPVGRSERRDPKCGEIKALPFRYMVRAAWLLDAT